MRLTKYSDYALRTLIYLALADRICTIQEVAESYAIPKNHLIKVVNQLATAGFIDSIRGKGGGIQLAATPEEINLGDVIRETEQNFELVECFSVENNQCVLSPQCKLAHLLADALNNFLNVFDQTTLADVVAPKLKPLVNLK